MPPYLISLRSISVLSSYLGLGLPSGLFTSGFPTKTPHALHFAPIRAACPASFNLHGFIILIMLCEEYKLWNEASRCAVFPNLLLFHPSSSQIFSAPCYNTFSVYILPIMWATKFHFHAKTTGKIVHLHIFIFALLDSRGEDRRF
jgi:hypothetical protein